MSLCTSNFMLYNPVSDYSWTLSY